MSKKSWEDWIDKEVERRGGKSFEEKLARGPKPRNYGRGDVVVVSDSRYPDYVGLRAEIKDFKYRERALRKGYPDITIKLTILDPPYEGKVINVQGGGVKTLDSWADVSEGVISSAEMERERRKTRSLERRDSEKRGKELLQENPELYEMASRGDWGGMSRFLREKGYTYDKYNELDVARSMDKTIRYGERGHYEID